MKRALLLAHQTKTGAEGDYDVLAKTLAERTQLLFRVQRASAASGLSMKRSLRRSVSVSTVCLALSRLLPSPLFVCR